MCQPTNVYKYIRSPTKRAGTEKKRRDGTTMSFFFKKKNIIMLVRLFYIGTAMGGNKYGVPRENKVK